MIVIKTVSKNTDGTYDVNWNLTADQVSFLMTYAINDLVAKGLIEVQNPPQQAELDFGIPVGGLH